MNDGKAKIAYYVNDGTTEMFEKYMRSALPFLCSREIKDKFAFYLIAVHPDLSDYDGRVEYHYVPHMSFDEFRQYLRDMRFDIGLAPLDEDGFSKYKYINKYVEYTQGGAAGIYSDCELYKTVIKDGENGLLCSGSGESWAKAIIKLVENPELRYNIALNAQQYAKDNLSINKVHEGLIKGVPELKDYKAPFHTISTSWLFMVKLYYVMLFRPCGWAYTLFCQIKNGKSKLIVHRLKRRIWRKEG